MSQPWRDVLPGLRGDRAWSELIASHRCYVGLEGPGSLHLIDLPPGGTTAAAVPVILIHGYGDSGYSWHHTAPALVGAGFRTLAVDQPGLGRSEAPPGHPFTIESQAAAIVTLADRLGLERFHLVGHSMGGAIALYLCLQHPGRIARAAVIAPVTRRPGRKLALAHRGAGVLAEVLAGRYVFALTLRQLYHDHARLRREVIDEYARPARRRGYWLDLARLSQRFFSPGFDRFVERLGEIRVPLLVVWGQSDRWLPARRGPFLVRSIEDARLEVIPRAGHNVHQERPERVNPLLLQHLRS